MSESVAVTTYHNPYCGTSRTVLALIRNAGVDPTVIEYLCLRLPLNMELEPARAKKLNTFGIDQPSIALKRKFLTVDVTVSPTCSGEKCRNFPCLSVPEAIEWE